MKNLLFLTFIFGLFVFTACGDDDSAMDTTPDYHIHVNSPNTDDKHVGDEITVSIEFEDHNGGKVHHVNVRIFNKVTGEEILNEPTEAHVHADVMHEFTKIMNLNVEAHTDWILEAKVWGHDAGLAEVTETVEFHVHP